MPRCAKCDASFKTLESLNQHCNAKQHFGCSVCDRAFGSQTALDQHLENTPIHQKTARLRQRIHECDYCDRTFLSDSALNQHLDSGIHDKGTSESDNSSPPASDDSSHQCKTCYKDFGALGSLQQHCDALGHHSTVRGRGISKPSHYYCDQCEKTFQSQMSLQQHLDSAPVHKSARCEECDRTFVSEMALQQHLEQNPAHNWPCPLCDSVFRTCQARDQHRNSSRHAGEPSFEPEPDSDHDCSWLPYFPPCLATDPELNNFRSAQPGKSISAPRKLVGDGSFDQPLPKAGADENYENPLERTAFVADPSISTKGTIGAIAEPLRVVAEDTMEKKSSDSDPTDAVAQITSITSDVKELNVNLSNVIEHVPMEERLSEPALMSAGEKTLTASDNTVPAKSPDLTLETTQTVGNEVSKKVHFCDYCSKQFVSKFALRQHLFSGCHDTNLPSMDQDELETYLDSCIYRTVKSCHLCKRNFVSTMALEQHLRTFKQHALVENKEESCSMVKLELAANSQTLAVENEKVTPEDASGAARVQLLLQEQLGTPLVNATGLDESPSIQEVDYQSLQEGIAQDDENLRDACKALQIGDVAPNQYLESTDHQSDSSWEDIGQIEM